MKLFKLWWDSSVYYDAYDSCIVAAINEEDAKSISPTRYQDEWGSIEEIQCEYIGEAAEGIKRGVILASFNAYETEDDIGWDY